MKQNWRIFEKVLSGVQIILGFLLLYVIATTITEYYTFLWKNPLFDHKSIIEISFKKNYILFILSIISISSGCQLINNSQNGWIASIVTWTIFIILLAFSFYRITINYPSDLNLSSKIVMYFVEIIFIIILVILNNSEFRKKYTPTKRSWIIIGSAVGILTLAKFIYS